MAGRIDLSLHGARLRLTAGRDDFLAFARAYLSLLMAEEGGEPSIAVEAAWDAPFATAAHGGWEQLGRRLWADGRRLRWTEIWQVPGLEMEVRRRDEGMTIRGAYAWPTRRARWLARWTASARERLFVALLYYLVYFPCAWWLEQERGWSLLHASAIATPEGGLVLSGLPGCGKSTTALAALRQPTWKVVSDNLIFTDGRRVFACPEPIHVDDAALGLIGDLDGRLRATGRRFSHRRQDYEPVPQARQGATTPRALGFLHVGPAATVRRIDPPAATRRLMANDYLAKEWMAYQESAATMHQLWSRIGDQDRRRQNLGALAGSIPCYEVTVPRDGDLGPAMEDVVRTMVYGQ